MRRPLVLVAIALVLSAAPAVQAHKADLIGRGTVATLRYGEATYSDAVGIFGAPSSRRTIDGCVDTLIAKWPGIKIWFDRKQPGQIAIIGFVRSRSVPTAGGSPLTIHTRKGLQVGDSLQELKRLYPDANGFRRPDGKRVFQLEGGEGHLYLIAIVEDGRVIRMISGMSC